MHESPCGGKREEGCGTPCDGIDLAQVPRAVTPREEHEVTEMQQPRNHRIGNARRRRPGKHRQHGDPQEPHQCLDQAQGEKAVKFQLDQNIPARMHDGRGEHGQKNGKFQITAPPAMALDHDLRE